MRVSRGEFRCAVKKLTESQCRSELVNKFSRIQNPVRIENLFKLLM